MLRLIFAGFAALCLSACGKTMVHGSDPQTIVMHETVNELEKEEVPGTQHDVWIEPMTDYVCYPGAIDPKNVYYRKAHCTLVEIRPNKFQKVQYPNGQGHYAEPNGGQ